MFVAVDAEEIGAFAGSLEGAVWGVFRVGRAPGSGIISSGRMFNFYDFCSVGGLVLTSVWCDGDGLV